MRNALLFSASLFCACGQPIVIDGHGSFDADEILAVGCTGTCVAPHDDLYEDNDSRAAAWTGGMSANWEEESLCDGYGCGVQANDDWYRIYVDEARVTVHCEFAHVDGNVDLELYDDTGTPLASSDSVSDNETVAIDLDGRLPAYLFVRVHGDDAGSAYDLVYWDGPAVSDD